MHSPGSAVRSPCHRPMAQIRTIKSNTAAAAHKQPALKVLAPNSSG